MYNYFERGCFQKISILIKSRMVRGHVGRGRGYFQKMFLSRMVRLGQVERGNF